MASNVHTDTEDSEIISIPFEDTQTSSNHCEIYSINEQVLESHELEISRHWVTSMQCVVLSNISKHGRILKTLGCITCLILYLIYFISALVYDFDNSISLIVITSIVVVLIVYAYVKDKYADRIDEAVIAPINHWIDNQWHYLKWLIYSTLALGILYYMAFIVIKEAKQIQSLFGLFLCILVPVLTCKHPSKIKWRPVVWGFGLQFLLGILVLRWTYGYEAVKWLSQEINKFLFYSLAGAATVFGDPWFFLHAFLMLVVPLVVWVGVVMAVCFHLGLIQSMARKLGWLMKITLQTTAIESVSLVVNIFLSVLDTMIMLKGYFPKLTKSEFHCFLVGAHSTIAGFAFGLFVLFGVQPQHLLTGAVMSAPAAVAIAKLNFPETEESYFKNDEDFDLDSGDDHNVFIAAYKGCLDAGRSVTEILIQTLTFVSLIVCGDEIVMWLGACVGLEISISILLSYLFMPITYLIGIDPEDIETVSTMLGIKVLANEFLGFIELGKAQAAGTLSERSGAIATYAMCGFSSFGTFAIFLGVWNSVDPSRTSEYASAIPRLMMNSNLACFTTACIANLLYSEEVARGSEATFNLFNVLRIFPRYEEILNFIGFPQY